MHAADYLYWLTTVKCQLLAVLIDVLLIPADWCGGKTNGRELVVDLSVFRIVSTSRYVRGVQMTTMVFFSKVVVHDAVFNVSVAMTLCCEVKSMLDKQYEDKDFGFLSSKVISSSVCE